MQKDLRPRDRGIDLIKTVAIFCVIVIHCGRYGDPVGSPQWMGALFWGALVRPAVPLFLMCSGALMLPPEKELTTKQLLLHSLPRLIAAMWVWAMVYKLWYLIPAGLALSGLWQAAKEVLLFRQEFHFYYLHMILLVYLFLPVTRAFVHSAEKRQAEYALLFWFAFGILYPTLLPYWPFSLLTGHVLEYRISMTYACIGYGLLGWYLCRWPLPKRADAALLGAGFVLVFGGAWFFSARSGALDERFFQGMSVPVCMMAAGAFGLLRRGGGRLRRGAFVEFVSKGSFCVYLVHVLFLYAFAHIGFTAEALPRPVSIPLLACAVFACSLAVYWVLRKIPVVNRWLI